MKLITDIITIIEETYFVIKLKCMFTDEDFENALINIIEEYSNKEILYITGQFKHKFTIEFSNRLGFILLTIHPTHNSHEYNTYTYLIDIEKNKILKF